jgi:hypothetical protein
VDLLDLLHFAGFAEIVLAFVGVDALDLRDAAFCFAGTEGVAFLGWPEMEVARAEEALLTLCCWGAGVRVGVCERILGTCG